MYGVILAGGSGSRFWPKSREKFPKQLLKIVGQKTMIQTTMDRLAPLIPAEKLFVATNESHAFETCRQLAGQGFDPARLLAEPAPKNTAAAIGWVARVIFDQDPKAVMAVFPADHMVNDPENFLDKLRVAKQAAETGYLTTLGVQPSRPETGYGYIKKSYPLKNLDGTFKVECFVEKPDRTRAEQFLADGNYFWNCGVFVWKVSAILSEIEKHFPELFKQLDAFVAEAKINSGKFAYNCLTDEGKTAFESLPSISIDYAVMEKSSRVAVIPADIEWSDVGSWDALLEVSAKDSAGNVTDENVISIDCERSIIQGDRRLIGAIGVKNMIVVDTPDALLVCDKDRAQDVKKLVEKLNKLQLPQTREPTTVQKPWGAYTVLEKCDNYLVKRIDVLPGETLSLQSHQHRSEHWTVVAGRAQVQIDNETVNLKVDKSIYIPKGAKHRLGNPGAATLVITEIQIGETLDENDITRYEDAYGRS